MRALRYIATSGGADNRNTLYTIYTTTNDVSVKKAILNYFVISKFAGPNDPLVKVDRMSMGHSLEVRCPLLDRRLVELAFRIPATMKQRGQQGKSLLRALARRRLGA